MSDGIQDIWTAFFQSRTKPLNQRFDGRYRALVVETNDPLQMHRVRFKCPELHDYDIKTEDCPWAVPSPEMGGKRTGSWISPCIGDIIWIEFEKNHPYGPVWTGFATPTRRKSYPLPSVSGQTPLPVDEKSNIIDPPNDYQTEYLPKDGRPMTHGWVDRYGNIDLNSAVGFFPAEHDATPPPPDVDALTKSKFIQAGSKPEVNNPDAKFMARVSKYGTIIQQSDIGYVWRRDGSDGEFTGDFDKDEKFEIDRWKYYQKLLNENSPDGDKRKLMLLTRYGHQLEMRDAGWNYSRNGELGQRQKIGSGSDQRWIKIRTKGGHLIQSIDAGSDSLEDEFVSRKLIDEIGKPIDAEDKFGDDARQIRIVTRAGLKIALDDRGSNKKNAQSRELKNTEIATGIIIKGRATPGAGDNYRNRGNDPVGYYWVIDERVGHNHTMWGSPLGQAIEINDDSESMVICNRLPGLPEKCKFLEDNEFPGSAFQFNPAHSTHHLILDLQREVIRLKSRAGAGQGPEFARFGNPTGGEHQGLEIHDAPADNPWVELIDCQKRGMWFSKGGELGVWRARDGQPMYIWMDDGSNRVVIHNNNRDGKIQIYCGGDAEIIARNIGLQASEVCTIKAEKGLNIQVGGARVAFTENEVDTNVDMKMRRCFAYFPQIKDGLGTPPGQPSGSGKAVANLNMVSVPVVEPDNRL